MFHWDLVDEGELALKQAQFLFMSEEGLGEFIVGEGCDRFGSCTLAAVLGLSSRARLRSRLHRPVAIGRHHGHQRGWRELRRVVGAVGDHFHILLRAHFEGACDRGFES